MPKRFSFSVVLAWQGIAYSALNHEKCTVSIMQCCRNAFHKANVIKPTHAELTRIFTCIYNGATITIRIECCHGYFVYCNVDWAYLPSLIKTGSRNWFLKVVQKSTDLQSSQIREAEGYYIFRICLPDFFQIQIPCG